MGSLITPAIRGRERNAVRHRPQQGALLIQFTDTTRSNQTEPIDPVEGVDELEQIRLANVEDDLAATPRRGVEIDATAVIPEGYTSKKNGPKKKGKTKKK